MRRELLNSWTGKGVSERTEADKERKFPHKPFHAPVFTRLQEDVSFWLGNNFMTCL